MRNLATLIFAMIILAASCGETARQEPLIETLPSGYGIYCCFDPEGIRLDLILEVLKPVLPESGVRRVTDALGFDPLNWDEWRNALALEPGNEIGVILDRRDGSVSLVCLYLPSTEPDSVRAVFSELLNISGDFRGVLDFREHDGYALVLIGDTPQTVESFDPEAPSLGESDPDFDMLRSAHFPEVRAASIFIRFYSMLDDNALDAALLETAVSGDVLRLRLALYTSDPTVIKIASVVRPPDIARKFTVPDSAASVLRLGLGMDSFLELIREEGIYREFNQGIEVLGVQSLEELMRCFSGDICITYGTSSDDYFSGLQFGLDDPAAMLSILQRLPDLAGDGEGRISPVEVDGGTFYMMDSGFYPGSESIMYGTSDDLLLISVGQDISSILCGVPIGEYFRNEGMGISADHCVVFASTTQLLQDLFGSRIYGLDYDADGFPGFRRMAGFIDTDGGLIELELAIEGASHQPFATMIELFGIVLQEAL